MSAPASSFKSVVAALSANAFVTVAKFVGFALSGSGAMLSEAIHSAADTGNQLLLFLGLRRAARQRDPSFQYGYGGERFVFGLLSAAGIFFIGCGFTVYHGVEGLLDPHLPELGPATFVVLGLSLVIEGGVTIYAYRNAFLEKGALPFFQWARERADPATIAVLLEDTVACLGLVLAATGIGLTAVTGDPRFDAAGSLLVGLLLGYVAFHLVVENRRLLLGKAVPEEASEAFVRILRGRPSIRDVHDVKTRQITPEVYKLKAEIAISEPWMAERLGAALPPALDAGDRSRALGKLAASAINALGNEIKAIEAAVRAEIPQAQHIDLELDHAPDPDDRAVA